MRVVQADGREPGGTGGGRGGVDGAGGRDTGRDGDQQGGEGQSGGGVLETHGTLRFPGPGHGGLRTHEES